MMAKKNKKSNNSKTNKNTNKVVDKELLLKQQKEIEANAYKIINQLNIDYKKFRFNFNKKKETKHLIVELEKLISAKEYDVLSSKMKSLELMYEAEKKDIINLTSTKNVKSERVKFDIVDFLKKARYPIFTRYKRIITEESGNNRIKKLCIVSGIILLLISISIIGFLMYFGMIPGIASSSTDTDNIFSIFVFAVPIGLLFII